MKEMDSTAAQRAPEPATSQGEGFANRKLIRPALNGREAPAGERRERPAGGGRKSVASPSQTHAENFYYQKQMQAKTPMVIVLRDGEQLRGVIEWYDRDSIKLARPGQSHLLVYKPSIKYMYKEGENGKK
jgi:sRNA-binding regulator protein Hfq